ncbi:MAG: GT4 family glycosyltransferase PelF [Acidimicrobiales bacterium]
MDTAVTVNEQQILHVALLTEGTYPYHPGGVSVWCDQLVRGMAPHQFSVYPIVAISGTEPTWELPENVIDLHPIALWGEPPVVAKSATRPEVQAAFTLLLESLVSPEGGSDFLNALHKLFDLSQEKSIDGTLRTSTSLAVLLEAMKVVKSRERPWANARRVVTITDACLAMDLIERQLRPLFRTPPKVNLCHATSNGLAVLPGLAANWAHGTPLVISEHGIYLRERYLSFDAATYTRPVRNIMLRFFKHLTWTGYQVATALAPGSEYNCQWLEANGCDPARIRPIYNGVDAPNFIRSTTEPDVPTLVYVGRIDPLKDIETLLHTFARVRQELPEARLRIFGTASKENREYLELCLHLADALELGDSCTFEGHVESVLEGYHAGHIVLLTSISEGFPYTLIEAMAAGKATVATDVGGVREATGGAGIIVPPQDPERMAEACLILLKDASLRHIVGRAARERILSRFTLVQSLAVFSDLYREVTGDMSSAPVLERHQASTDEQLLEQFVRQLVERFVGQLVEADTVDELGAARRYVDGVAESA